MMALITDFSPIDLTPEFRVGSNSLNIQSDVPNVLSGVSLRPAGQAPVGISLYNTDNEVDYSWANISINSEIPDSLLLTTRSVGSGVPITNLTIKIPSITLDSNLVFQKLPTSGIKIDPVSPSFGWQDLLAPIVVDIGATSNKPQFSSYIGNIKQFQFSVNDQVYTEYHIPHDYVLGSDIYIHAHWSHNNSAVTTGAVEWGFEITHAKGHNRQSFSTPISTSISADAPLDQHRHMITETIITGPGLLTANDIEPDSLILVRIHLKSNSMDNSAKPFLHFCDLHYQSTGIGTKQKAPNFYE